MTAADASAAAAQALCDDPSGAARVAPGLRADVGWALKAACYAAWSSEPARALQAAGALRALAVADGGTLLLALADWCDGIACLVRGEMAAALPALDAASAGWRARGQLLHAAQAQVPKIMALAVLGRFDAAESCALAAEAALRAEGDDHAAARVRLNLGSLAYSRDRHAEAAEHYRAAAVRFARAGDSEHSVMADIGHADALSYLGRFDAAGQSYTRARLRADAHALPVLAAMADHGGALLALSQGRYRDALAGLESVRRAFAALALPHRRVEAEKNLADAYLELRLLPEAIALYTGLAASLRAQQAGATLPWVLAQLARAQALHGRPDRALQTLADASAGFDAQDNAAGRATAAVVQAELHAAAGRPQQALDWALQAGAGFAAAGLLPQQAAARVQAAAARTACGQAAQALDDCDALLAAPGVAPQVQVRAQVARAEALLALAQHGAARAALASAIDGIEELRAVLPGDDLRRAFLADASRPYALRLQMALDDAPADGAWPVLHWLERYKARTLHDRLGRGPVDAAAPAGDAPLRDRLNWIYRRQQRLVEDDGEAPQVLRDEAARIEGQLLENARRARLLQPAPPRALPPHAAALPAALGPGRALVAYGVAADELFAVVVDAGGARLLRGLASWAAVLRAVQGLRFQIDALRAGAALPAAQLPLLRERAERRLAQLHALVWQPLAAAVDSAERIVLVPHGALHGVPFAALTGAGAALVDRHELVLAASAGAALRSLAQPADDGAARPALVLGDSSRLPHVARELRAVAAALGGAAVLDGTPASVAALRAAAPRAGVLHLACHATFRADSPLFSALHLGDGALTADLVEALPLRAGLVVLSCCESAQADTGVADDGVGLVRAFLAAGAAAVLGSVWSVDDAATADFMADFHRRRQTGLRTAQALRQAQLAQRERWPHPAHWAAFALHGAG